MESGWGVSAQAGDSHRLHITNAQRVSCSEALPAVSVLILTHRYSCWSQALDLSHRCTLGMGKVRMFKFEASSQDLWIPGETADQRALVGSEPGRRARGGVLGHALRPRGRRDRHMAARVAEDPLVGTPIESPSTGARRGHPFCSRHTTRV
jgi:hypothetical protein